MKLSTKLLTAALVVCANAHNLRASLAPGDLGVPTQMAANTILVKSVLGKCLDTPHGSALGGLVHMWDCIPGNQNQHWLYGPSTLLLQAGGGGIAWMLVNATLPGNGC